MWCGEKRKIKTGKRKNRKKEGRKKAKENILGIRKGKSCKQCPTVRLKRNLEMCVR
jgi:hypothetical protein